MKTEALGAWSKRLRGVFGRYKFVLLVILAGAALLLLPSVGEKETAAEQTAEQTSLLQSVDALERRLEGGPFAHGRSGGGDGGTYREKQRPPDPGARTARPRSGARQPIRS